MLNCLSHKTSALLDLNLHRQLSGVWPQFLQTPPLPADIPATVFGYLDDDLQIINLGLTVGFFDAPAGALHGKQRRKKRDD